MSAEATEKQNRGDRMETLCEHPVHQLEYKVHHFHQKAVLSVYKRANPDVSLPRKSVLVLAMLSSWERSSSERINCFAFAMT